MSLAEEVRALALRLREAGIVGPAQSLMVQVRLVAKAERARGRQIAEDLLIVQPKFVDLTGRTIGLWRVLRYLRPGSAAVPTPVWEVECTTKGHRREMRGSALRNRPPMYCRACHPRFGGA